MHRTGEKLHAVGALLGEPTHVLHSFVGRFHDRRAELFRCDQLADINRRFGPKWIADGEDLRPAQLATCDAISQKQGLIKIRREIEHVGEAPAVKHLVQDGIQVGGRCVRPQYRPDQVHMAVPKTGDD